MSSPPLPLRVLVTLAGTDTVITHSSDSSIDLRCRLDTVSYKKTGKGYPHTNTTYSAHITVAVCADDTVPCVDPLPCLPTLNELKPPLGSLSLDIPVSGEEEWTGGWVRDMGGRKAEGTFMKANRVWLCSCCMNEKQLLVWILPFMHICNELHYSVLIKTRFSV